MNDNLQIATFAGGCFWCTEAIFNRLKGVERVVSGYTGGHIKNPAYREICTGRTGHAEAIQIFYNESIISYTELLEIFFATHDPTTLDRQGNDVGTQYRSAIFYSNDSQKEEATDFISYLEKENIFNKLIKIASPVFATSVTYLIPIVALFWGFIDGENLLLQYFLGVIFILSGVYLVNKKVA